MSETNVTVVQAGVNVTIDPISSDQLNQSSVTVIGSMDNPADTITVNGVSAAVNDDGTWEADNVPVNWTGMANLDVEVSDSDNHPLASQAVNQPQPAMVAAVNYQSTEHLVDIINVDYIPGVEVDNSTGYWLAGQGGQWSNWSWGESLDGYWDDGPVSASNGGEIATVSTWENASLNGSFYPYQTLQEICSDQSGDLARRRGGPGDDCVLSCSGEGHAILPAILLWRCLSRPAAGARMVAGSETNTPQHRHHQ